MTMTRNEDEASNAKIAKGPLERVFNKDTIDIGDQAIARCLYANRLLFNVV